ncbi:MAG: carbohydrate ABC transporter permease [Ruminococcus flavefaciens]|nr:carbohydrate ABC transporter permease [Ruminococcus flavefaciens]MCM1228567.1 carbohydrate ABC transporter permease [Ruminococcus flavefaciens]
MIKTKKQKAGGFFTALVLIILGAFMFLPIYLTIVMSLKPQEELFIFPPELYTLRPTLDNFRSMFDLLDNSRVPFSRYLFNSIAVTFSVTFLQCVFVSMSAFVLAKCRFPGGKLINSVIVTALLYQSNVIYIMQYAVMSELGIIDTPLALILPSIASPIGLFLMKQSISQMPDAVIESAKIDGAGLFRICWQIVLPNQKPAFMTLIIFAFQASWNMQGGNLVFQEQYKTLPTVIAQISSSGLARAGETMAASVFMLVPPVIVFMTAQKHIIDTMAHSGIKN